MNKYSLYLLKDSVSEPGDAFTDRALKLFPDHAQEAEHDGSHEYDDLEVFFFYQDPRFPKWTELLPDFVELPEQLETVSSGGLYFVKEAGRWFAFSFGTGHHFLDRRKIVLDFGLRVAVNMLDDSKVKSREGFEVAKSQRGASQAIVSASFSELSSPGTVEIVKSISGKIESYGTVSGSTSLKFASEKPITHLSEDVYGALKAYTSKSYVGTEFEVIDDLQPIKDKSVIAILDSLLVEAIENDDGEVELVIPQLPTQDADISYIRYLGLGISPPPESFEISIESYVSALPEDEKVTVGGIKSHRIMAHDQSGGTVHYDNVYSCLVGTVESDLSGAKSKYVINEGDWFQVSDRFKDKVDSFFDQIRDKANDEEFSELKLVLATAKRKKKTDGYETELSYNTRVAGELDFVLMDQEFVKVPGIGGRGFEFCDLLDVNKKRLIHVKKGSRQSSVLSHFFNQGTTPLSFYKSDNEFCDAVKAKIQEISVPAHTNFVGHDVSDYMVHYVVIDKPRGKKGFNIPFFSRITLYEKARDIRALAKGVSISFMKPESP